jgi:predicted DNA-binding protein
MGYTTIRISVEDKKKLEKLSRRLNKSLAETLRYAINVAEKETDEFRGDLNAVLSSLKEAKDVGKTNAEKVDEYIYGGAD